MIEVKPVSPGFFWKRADTFRLVQIILVGLTVGIVGRYLYVTAPPLPVLATGATLSPSTNVPPALKIEGASPSARD